MWVGRAHQMKLVRIPSKQHDGATALAPAVAEVVVTRDAADNTVLQVGFSSLSDRRNLLFNVVRPTHPPQRVVRGESMKRGERRCTVRSAAVSSLMAGSGWWWQVRTLRDFPLEVLGAVYSTEAGAVLEDLRLRERPGQQVSLEELEHALAEALNNEPPSPIQVPAGKWMRNREREPDDAV